MPRYEFDANGRPSAIILGSGLNAKRIEIRRQDNELRLELLRAIVRALRARFPEAREQDVLEVFIGIRPSNAEPITRAIRQELDARGA